MPREHFAYPTRHANLHFDKDKEYRSEQRAADAEYNDMYLEDWLNRVVTASGGDSLWQYDGFTLEPITPPSDLLYLISDGDVQILTGNNGDITLSADDDVNIGTNNGEIRINAGASGTENLLLAASDSVNIIGNVNVSISVVTGFLLLNGIPTANPGGSGRVWSNGGVLTIT